MRKASFFSVLLLSACVTINIYFPAAAAEKVADEIIKGIQTEEKTLSEPKTEESPQSHSIKLHSFKLQVIAYQLLDNVLNIVIPVAHAEEANLSVNTSEITNLRSAMQSRFSALKPFYANGLVGIKSDGFIVTRGSIPLRDRNKVNKLVAAENTDRQHLYQAIANANGHPEWLAQIKSTFASRWASNAQSGWWYQTSNGSWKQK
ncbi:MAG: YdbL family protein [Methylococcales bacterium]|nr:YdbL family protein [Methylococcales bacterium]